MLPRAAGMDTDQNYDRPTRLSLPLAQRAPEDSVNKTCVQGSAGKAPPAALAIGV
jgi:hypothetical protein